LRVLLILGDAAGISSLSPSICDNPPYHVLGKGICTQFNNYILFQIPFILLPATSSICNLAGELTSNGTLMLDGDLGLFNPLLAPDM
jgi:hypothetical protein